MDYKTFSDLMKEVGNLNNDIGYEDSRTGPLLDFYRYWGNYLEPTSTFIAFMINFSEALVKTFYYIIFSLEKVFNNSFKLFGLFGYLGDDKTLIGQFFFWFQVLGVSFFIVIVMAKVIFGLFGKRPKYNDILNQFMLVLAVTSVLPMGLTTMATAMAEDAQTIQTISPSGETKYSSLAIQPIVNNVVDLKVLIENDFDQDKFSMDEYGFIKPRLSSNEDKEALPALNNITDDSSKRDTEHYISNVDLSATYGVTDTELLEQLEKKNKGLKGLFLHQINSNQDGIQTINEHRVANGMNAFESVFMRYKVNWIAMIAQYIVLGILLGVMCVKIPKSVFEVTMMGIISPIQGFTSSIRKYKELLMTIGGSLAAIFFEVIIVRVVMEICRDLPNLSFSAVSTLSGGFFNGMNMWEQSLAAIFVYIGVLLAAMNGVAMIERWIGVSTGHNDTTQQMLGAMMMGGALLRGGQALGHGLGATTGMAGNIAKATPSIVAGGAKGIANAAAKGQGIADAVQDSVKNQGLKKTLGAGVQSGVNGAMGIAEELEAKRAVAQATMSHNLGNKRDAAYTKTRDALHNSAYPQGTHNVNGEPTLEPVGGYVPQSDQPQGLNLDSASVPDDVAEPKPEGSIKNTQPNSQSSSPSHFNQSMQNMQYMSQQIQQAGQNLNSGQGHIKGVQLDDEE